MGVTKFGFICTIAQTGGSVKRSKRTTADNTTYVFVDDPGKLDVYGTDGDSISKKTRLYMREHFRGVVLPLGKSKGAYVRSDGINEYTNPVFILSSTNYESKLRAATELQNLLESSEFLNWKADDGRHADAVRGWNNWLTRYAVQDPRTNEIRAFEGEVRIKRIAKGDVFYDITKIREITNSNMGQSMIADAQYVAVGDNFSIVQDGSSVKRSKRTDGLSGCDIMMQAFESVTANDAERETLAKYQSQIETLDVKR